MQKFFLSMQITGESLTTKKSSYIFTRENTENTFKEIYAFKKRKGWVITIYISHNLEIWHHKCCEKMQRLNWHPENINKQMQL